MQEQPQSDSVPGISELDWLTSLVASSVDAIIATGLDGLIHTWSPGAERLYGYTAAEMMGQSVAMLVPPEHPDELEPLAERVRQGERISHYETIRVHKDGTRIAVSMSFSPIRGEGGVTLGAAVIARDISERKRAEQALRESEARIRAIVETAVDGIIALDEEGVIEAFNPAAERLFGYQASEMIGRNVALLMPDPQHPAHSYIDDYLRTGVARIIGIGREVAGQRKDGSSFPLELTIAEVNLGIRRTFTCTVRDVSDRKRAEDALMRERDFRRRVVDSATNAIGALDLGGCFTFVNRNLCELTGYSEAELVGMDVRRVLAPDRLDEALASLGDVLTNGTLVSRFETEVMRKDGVRRLIEFSVGPLMEGGAITGLAGVAEDVTDRRRLEAQYLQAQKMESIGLLAGGVAHDFNNLMTAIIGYAELGIASLKAGEDAEDDFVEIRATAVRAAAVTEQLLAFARKQIIQPQTMKLNEVIVQAERMLSRLITESIELVTVLAPDLGQVQMDPSQFEQVVMNLVVNARDAMPDGGRLTIATANADVDARQANETGAVGAGRYVVLSVTDTGIGMDAETRRHAFEPFFTTKEHGRGTGLGLATCYGIVLQAGGGIGVHSEPGVGSTFRIYLPRVLEQATPNRVAPLPEALPRGHEKILLVEDEEAVRKVAARILGGLGYSVVEATNGGEALRIVGASDRHFDLIVTDVVMPEVGGAGVAAALREAGSTAKVLFTSGYTDDSLLRHGVTEHSLAFLQKPFSSAQLARAVRDLLDAAP